MEGLEGACLQNCGQKRSSGRARRHQLGQFGKNVYRKFLANFHFLSVGKGTSTINHWSCHYSGKCVKNHSRPLCSAGAVQCLELLSSSKNHFFLGFYLKSTHRSPYPKPARSVTASLTPPPPSSQNFHLKSQFRAINPLTKAARLS